MIKYREVKGGYVVTEAICIQTEIRPKVGIINKTSAINKSGQITLGPGFFWDGATGVVDTPSIMEASAFHDFICNEYNKGRLTKLQRKQGDKMFKDKLKETNMPKFRIKYVYQVVRKFFELKGWFKKIF